MPSPAIPAPPRLPIEDSYFELLADTLESLDLPARGQFLQRYFRANLRVLKFGMKCWCGAASSAISWVAGFL